MPNLKFLASNVQPTPICLFSIQLHDATIKINEKKATVLVGLDLSAAFDTINHDVLINHLESQFGVDSGASSWLRSYLTDRQQFVKLGDHSSTATQCASGVPQGSVLTAHHSIRVAVRELIESHGVSYRQFADDTQLLVAMNVADAGPALEKLANCSTAVRLWCVTTYSPTQTSLRSSLLALHLSSGRLLISMKSRSPAVAPKLKSLGVTIDSHLRFDCHAK